MENQPISTNIVHIVAFETRTPYLDARGARRLRWGEGMAAYESKADAVQTFKAHLADKDYRNVKLRMLVINPPGLTRHATAPGALYVQVTGRPVG